MAMRRTSRFSRRRMLQGTAWMLGGLSGSAILAACGGSPAPPAPNPAGSTGGAPPAKPAESKPAAPAAQPAATTAGAAANPSGATQRVVIRDHDWIQGTPGQPSDWYDGFIAKFEEANPDIKVEREWFPRAEMHAKQVALAATGQIGDTVRINLAPIVSELQIKGVMHDLNSLYEGDKEWVEKDLPQFWPGNLKTYTRDGKLWGLPVVGHPGAVHYFINKTMAEKNGLKMPPGDGKWSFEDLHTLAKGLTKSEGGRTTVYGVIPPINNNSANEGLVSFLRAHAGDLFDAEGKKCLLNTAESKAGLRVVAEMYKQGWAQPWAPNIDDQRQELFFGQRVGMIIQTAFAASAWPGQIAKLAQSFEMEVVPIPVGPTGKHATQVSSDGKGIAKLTKNPDKAWRVLSRLYTSQRHGIERFANGLGSPGSRFDVWNSDEFRQKAPKLDNIAKTLVLPPAPEMVAWHHPANGRFFETEPILINEFVKVTLGQLDVDKFADDATRQIQEIMDKPTV